MEGRATFFEAAAAGSETHALPFSARHKRDKLAKLLASSPPGAAQYSVIRWLYLRVNTHILSTPMDKDYYYLSTTDSRWLYQFSTLGKSVIIIY